MDTHAAAHALEPTDGPIMPEELQLASRNRGMPLEALRWDLTPTGLHYLLIHFDIPAVDPETWRLGLGGRVSRPLSLTLDELRARPRRTIPVTLECAGNGRGLLSPRPVSVPWLGGAIGTAEWTGTPLHELVEEAGLEPGAVELVFRGADRGIQGDDDHHYARSLTVEEIARGDALLAYEMNGRPLEPQHGFPLRLIVPGWYGMTSVKWLDSIEAVTEPFEGFQQYVSYRYQRDAADVPGEPVSRIRVRALMIPPGRPDFFSRERFAAAGPTTVFGRAWSGAAPVERVELAVDGRWADATLEAPLGRVRLARLELRVGRDAGQARAGLPGDGRRRATRSPPSRRGTTRGWATTASSGSRSRWRDVAGSRVQDQNSSL